MAIFVLTTTTRPIALPLAHACGVIMLCTYSKGSVVGAALPIVVETLNYRVAPEQNPNQVLNDIHRI